MSTKRKKKKKSKKKIVIDPITMSHNNEIKKVFEKIGFQRLVTNKEITFLGKKSDIDFLFLYENIVVIVEATCTKKSGEINDHLTSKKYLFDLLLDNKEDFINYLNIECEQFTANKNPIYEPNHYKIIILYCSRYDFEEEHKNRYIKIKYFDYAILKYFLTISEILKKSARYEFLNYLGLNYSQIGMQVLKSSGLPITPYNGSILPESFSNFKNGYKVISFYIDPESLLQKSYVLRKDGWRDTEGSYQRMIIKSKIRKMRQYLDENKRVFINNIIVTLPHDTKILNTDGNTVSFDNIDKTTAVNIQIPNEFNSVGIIDGQHRIYAYHEGDDRYEKTISSLRTKQNLLVTGIRYPDKLEPTEKAKFEANLFLEINATQSAAKADLKQSINLILRPFDAEAIAKAVISKMSQKGPLESLLEIYFFDTDKIKTTSIVAYGLKPIVKLSGEDSLFKLWNNPKKTEMLKMEDHHLLHEYIDFCTKEINNIFTGYKINIPSEKWTPDQKKSKNVTTTSINGIINCLRLLIESNKTGAIDYYKIKFKGIDTFKFGEYKSSQWRKLGEHLFNKFFNKP